MYGQEGIKSCDVEDSLTPEHGYSLFYTAPCVRNLKPRQSWISGTACLSFWGFSCFVSGLQPLP